MCSAKPPRITFDTNVCNVIHDPEKWPDLVKPEDARRIREAIKDGRLLAFVSEASVFVECLSFSDKLAYLAVAGTPDPRPSPDPRMVAMFDDLAKLGVKLLHAPLIGSEKFVEAFEWATDDIFNAQERHDRFSSFARPLPRHEPLQQYGRGLLANQPPVPSGKVFNQGPNSFSVSVPQDWAVAIKREWDGNPAGRKGLERMVRPAIGEWCDALILGSHVGYGNDVFCTTDSGKNAGVRSLLHHTNRANLKAQGITIMTPAELVEHFKLQSRACWVASVLRCLGL